MAIIYGEGADTLSWTQARDKVRSDLWRPGISGVPDDVADRALHAGLRRLETERKWLWLQAVQATLTAETQTDVLDAPADCASISSLAYLNGDIGFDPVRAASLEYTRQEARGGQLGYPTYHAFVAATPPKIYLDAFVIAGSQFHLIYQAKTPDSIAACIATPPFTLTHRQEAVIAAACRHVALSYLKNTEEAVRQEAAYQTMLEIYEAEEDQARSDDYGPGIEPDMTYYDAARGRA
ncbi:MAG: hypothetical protein A2792_01045 [Sphingomonadales bacterium RIFCSPHIGHO2_01_FULL_65_20]|uniref:hypothetical protein n=1 Tax=Blastomonas sp. TaxID=1909299 RepID=UPI0008CD998F|nr:hypothetical protein [Blastomonas sp.]OHC93767.1 MAG: hypothetical protein A2792_01045 [Sphingomonadales bacterium RIFCSPHIGHO2_01_FULL_65_20]